MDPGSSSHLSEKVLIYMSPKMLNLRLWKVFGDDSSGLDYSFSSNSVDQKITELKR